MLAGCSSCFDRLAHRLVPRLVPLRHRNSFLGLLLDHARLRACSDRILDVEYIGRLDLSLLLIPGTLRSVGPIDLGRFDRRWRHHFVLVDLGEPSCRYPARIALPIPTIVESDIAMLHRLDRCQPGVLLRDGSFG